MMFISEEVEYSVAEFFDRFANSLPKIVKVSQGFCSEIIEDTFDRDQVIRLHTISRQKRVVAKQEEYGRTKYFSIPLNHQNMKLCEIDKEGKVGNEIDLSDIVKKGQCLPVTVQFPRDKSAEVGNQHIGSNNVPCLELTKIFFDEIYFLGNCLDDEQMSRHVIKVPLYLSQLRISLVTGIAGQSQNTWEKLQMSLSKAAGNIQYKKDFGNPEMAEYQKSSFEETSDELYCYITPIHYHNTLPPVACKGPSDLRNNMKGNKARQDQHAPVKPTYKASEFIRRHGVGNGGYSYELIENNDMKAKRAVADIPRKSEGRTVLSVSHDCAINPPGLVPPVPPRTGLQKLNNRPKETVHCESNIPRRHVVPIMNVTNKDTSAAQDVVDVNKIPEKTDEFLRAPIIPTKPECLRPVKGNTNIEKLQSTSDDTIHFRKNITQHVGTVMQKTAGDMEIPVVVPSRLPKPTNGPKDIETLKISDVSEYLGVLGLEAYIEDFRHQQVDGKLLKDVDKDILKYEFGMKAIEAARLMHFIEEGHIPK